MGSFVLNIYYVGKDLLSVGGNIEGIYILKLRKYWFFIGGIFFYVGKSYLSLKFNFLVGLGNCVYVYSGVCKIKGDRF